MSEVVAPTLSDRLVRLTVEAVGAAGGAVALITPEARTLLGSYPRSLAGINPALLELCRRVAEEEIPAVRPDIAQDGVFAAQLRVLGGYGLWVRSYAGAPVRDERGRVIGAVCVTDQAAHGWTPEDLAMIEDAAELVASGLREDRLRYLTAQRREAEQSRAFLNALLDTLDTGVVACDIEGRLVLFNRTQRRLYGDPGALPSRRWAARFGVRHTDGSLATEAEMPLVRALGGEVVRGVDLYVEGVDGRRRLFMINAAPILGPAGERLGAVAAAHDVTEQRRVERLHACEVAVARALSPAGDNDQALPAALEALVRELGWARAELWQVDRLDQVLRLEASWTVEELAEAAIVPRPLRRGAGLAGAGWQTGKPIWLPELAEADSPVPGGGLRSAIVIPVHGGPDLLGVLVGYTANCEEADDGLLVRLAAVAANLGQFVERRRAEDLALRLVRSKDEYIALVGHELRTPLTSIASYAALLNELDDSTPLAEVRHLLGVIDRNTEKLRAVVDDLLDLAALDSGHATICREPVDLVPLIQDCANKLLPSARRANVRMTVRLPERAVVAGDHPRLRQLMDNVLGNAINYAPGGSVSLSCAPQERTVSVTVVDTGLGISEEERELVTRRFYRGQAARDSGLPGHGLGLAVCGVIVERHGGSIALLPTEGGGTTVELRLPRPSRP